MVMFSLIRYLVVFRIGNWVFLRAYLDSFLVRGFKLWVLDLDISGALRG